MIPSHRGRGRPGQGRGQKPRHGAGPRPSHGGHPPHGAAHGGKPAHAPGHPHAGRPGAGGKPGGPRHPRERSATGGPPPVKEHPQYGTRIPPEELELMRQVAEETARGQRSPYAERRPMVGPGPRQHPGPRHPGAGQTGPRFPAGGPRHPGDRGPAAHGAPRPHRYRETDRSGPRPEPRDRDRVTPPRRPYRTGVQRAGEGPPRPAPAPEEPPLGRLRALLSGYQTTAAILAAHSLGLFRHLHQKPQVLSDLARACGADTRGMEALLDALVSFGLLHRHGATYVLPGDFAPYFVPGVNGDATGLVEMTADLYGIWMELARGMREGAPRYRLSSEALLMGDPQRVRRYIRGVHTVSREAAGRLTELAPVPPGSTLLDVAGGSGIIAAEYARRTPNLTAHLFDLPPTLEIAREILRQEGLEDAVTYAAGDYRRDPFPGPVDTVLLSNVLQTESEEHAILILRKAREALRPGGTLLVHGTMGEAAADSSSLGLAPLFLYVLFDHGRVWSVEQISEWVVQEGFGVRSVRPLGPPFQTRLLTANRLE